EIKGVKIEGELKDKLYKLRNEYYEGIKQQNNALDPNDRFSDEYLQKYANTMAKYHFLVSQKKPSIKKKLSYPSSPDSQTSEADRQFLEAQKIGGELEEFAEGD